MTFDRCLIFGTAQFSEDRLPTRLEARWYGSFFDNCKIIFGQVAEFSQFSTVQIRPGFPNKDGRVHSTEASWRAYWP